MGLSRYLRFNAVGVAGFAVQIAVVWFLSHVESGFGRTGAASGLNQTWQLAVITAVAVEAAILHNFFWHERWTWADRPAAGRDRLARLVRFHLTNGLVSIAGNVAIVLLLSPVASAILAVNAVAVLVCSLVNFATGDWLVFVRPPPAARSSPMCP